MQKFIVAAALACLSAILYFGNAMNRCDGDRCAHPVMMSLLALGGCAVVALLGAETWWIDRRRGEQVSGLFKCTMLLTGAVAAATLITMILAAMR